MATHLAAVWCKRWRDDIPLSYISVLQVYRCECRVRDQQIQHVSRTDQRLSLVQQSSWAFLGKFKECVCWCSFWMPRSLSLELRWPLSARRSLPLSCLVRFVCLAPFFVLSLCQYHSGILSLSLISILSLILTFILIFSFSHSPSLSRSL